MSFRNSLSNIISKLKRDDVVKAYRGEDGYGIVFRDMILQNTELDLNFDLKKYCGKRVIKVGKTEVNNLKEVVKAMNEVAVGGFVLLQFEGNDNFASTPLTPQSSPPETVASKQESRSDPFQDSLNAKCVELGETRDCGLRSLAWNGVPDQYRYDCWKIITGCTPCEKFRRPQEAEFKLSEYKHLLSKYWSNDIDSDDGNPQIDDSILRQVKVDVKRMQPGVALFRTKPIFDICVRILYCWGVRHPASGYVQGMDALLSPFIVVAFSEELGFDALLCESTADLESNLLNICPEELLILECECYACLSVLLEHVQDFYIPSQPGVQITSQKVSLLCEKIDKQLYDHIIGLGADIMRDFIWRWSTCFLVREVPLRLAKRLWDCFLAEGADCGEFLIFICLRFLFQWRTAILEKDFSELKVFLRALPTEQLTEEEVGIWISEAYVLQKTYDHILTGASPQRSHEDGF